MPPFRSHGNAAPSNTSVYPIVNIADPFGGCVTCRARKLQCDNQHPVCEQCRQCGFECIRGQLSSPSPSQSQGATNSSARTRLACLPCRTRKIRCAGPVSDNGDARCLRCARLSLNCSWVPKRPPRTDGHRILPVTDQSVREASEPGPREPEAVDISLDTALANKSELRSLAHLYFGTVHFYGCLRYIHEPSYLRLLDVNKAPRELTAIMIASTLRYACEPVPKVLARADSLFDEAMHTLRDRIYNGYGAIELMAIVLAHQYEHARGRFSSAWLLWGNAVRMMQFLCLHTLEETYPHPVPLRLNPLLKREALRRLAWAIFYQDTMIDAGRHGVHLVTESDFRIQLPSNEAAFIRGQEVATAPLNPGYSHSPFDLVRSPTHNEAPTNLGMAAYIIRTAALRRRVLHFNSLVRHSVDSPRKMLDDLALFEVELKRVIADLPEELSYSEHNLFIQAAARPGFVLLHLLRHNCFLMLALSRLSVTSRDPTLEDVGRAARYDRIRHAIPVSRIVSDIIRLGINCDPFVSVQAYTSLEILLFDPLRLSQTDPSINAKEPRFREAVAVLLEMLRRQTLMEERVRLLRVEACRRLSHCGFVDLLSEGDRTLCKSDLPASNQEDTEFDFRAFRWHRFESSRQNRVNTSDEAFLHPEPASLGVSRAASPGLNVLDAASIATEGQASPYASTIIATPSPVPVHDIGFMLNGSSIGLPHPTEVGGITGTMPALPVPSTARWLDLDYGSEAQTQLPAFEDFGLGFGQGETFTDDFACFLEQAGCAGAEQADPFAWLSQI